MSIYIDADACPVVVKDLLFKTSKRLLLTLVLVANQYMKIPVSDYIQFVLVPEGPDVADDKIVELVLENDLVITADIPLADRVIKKGAVVLDPRGTLLTEENIGERLAYRNLMDDLRSNGMETGGPSAYTAKDKQEFANQLSKFLNKHINK